MQKYAENMPKYAVSPHILLLCENMQKYAENMQKYAKYAIMKNICNICKNMHPPLSSANHPPIIRDYSFFHQLLQLFAIIRNYSFNYSWLFLHDYS